mmetsp:Transcript_29481/g.44753  ORF Transcript_29481/g.44753 Transcript_29481/m.44753 type:complete len:113 (-) Transcript_29481:4251-4589(-)
MEGVSSHLATKQEETVPKVLPLPSDSGSPKDFFQNILKSDNQESLREVPQSSFSSEDDHQIIDELYEKPIESSLRVETPLPASSSKRRIDTVNSDLNNSNSKSRDVYRLPSE